MIALIENILLALTDAQFDRILVMIGDGFSAIQSAVQTIWTMVAPIIGLWLAWKCQQIIANQKSNRKALDENTEVSVKAFESANNFHLKADKLAEKIDEVKHKVDK